MKTNLLALAAALLMPLASHAAQPKTGVDFASLSELDNQVTTLDRCGGTASLERVNGVLTLQVRNATCSNLVTKNGSWKL